MQPHAAEPLRAALTAATTAFGELPALDIVVVAGRLRVRISHQTVLKVQALRSEYRVTAVPEIGRRVGPMTTAVTSPNSAEGWLSWRVFELEGLRNVFATMYPAVRQLCNQVSAGARLNDLLEGTLQTRVADQGDWEYWDALAAFADDRPLKGYQDVKAPSRLARAYGRRILKYGALSPADLEAGGGIAASAKLQGFRPPLVEDSDEGTSDLITVYESIDSTPAPNPTPRPRPSGKKCIHGYPPGVCASCNARGGAHR